MAVTPAPKNITAARLRVLAAVLALGLIAGALCYRTQTLVSASAQGSQQTPKSQSESGSAADASFAALPEESLALPHQAQPATARPAVIQPKVFSSESQLQTAWKQSTARMKYLDHCAQTGKCPAFDQSGPASYDLEVRRQTAREIDDFARLTKTWMNSHAGEMPEEAQVVARYFLKNGNDDVKDSAIRLLDLAPVSITNLQSATAAVEDSSSGPLMKVFLKTEMVKACGDQSYAAVCNAFINRTARRGSEGEQKALAKNGLSIFTPYTVQALTRFEQSESPRSQTRLYLHLNRQEFLRFQRGS